MSTLTEWFEGRSVDDQTILPLPFWALLLLALIVLLPGCATAEPESKVCFMQLMGRTESGLSVVRQACLTEEQFAETQK